LAHSNKAAAYNIRKVLNRFFQAWKLVSSLTALFINLFLQSGSLAKPDHHHCHHSQKAHDEKAVPKNRAHDLTPAIFRLPYSCKYRHLTGRISSFPSTEKSGGAKRLSNFFLAKLSKELDILR
jgi:hypothetical protein